MEFLFRVSLVVSNIDVQDIASAAHYILEIIRFNLAFEAEKMEYILKRNWPDMIRSTVT
jgi:hypothetical protein